MTLTIDAIVTDVATFKFALENNNTETITLGGDISGDVTATREGNTNFTIGFENYTLTGDLDITADSVTTTITLNGSADPSITGDLRVTAGLATVTNNITVGGDVIIIDVGGDSWIERADGNKIILTDPDGASIVIKGKPEDITITEDAAGGISITVKKGAEVTSITTSKPVYIEVEAGATVTNIEASGYAKGTTITNNGSVTNVIANVNIDLENNSGAVTVVGNGEVDVSGTASDNVNIIVDKPVYNMTKMVAYSALPEAVDAATTNDTILLVSNIELKNTLTINKSITLDLNGKTLKTPNVVAKSPIMVLQIQGGTTDVTIKGVGLIQSGSTTNHTSGIDNNPSIWVWQGASLTIKNGSTIRGADAINSYEAAPAIWFMSSNSILNVQNAEVYGGDCIKSNTSDLGIYSNDGTAGVAINLVVASNSTVNIEGSTISGGHGVNHDYASFKQGEGYKQASGGMAFYMNQTNKINIKGSTIRGGNSDLLHGGHAIQLNAGVFDIKTSAIIGGNGNTSDGYGAGKAIFVVTSGSGEYTIDGLSTTTDGGLSN